MSKFFNKDDYTSDWREISKKCKKRDNYTCRSCGYNQKINKEFRYLHADHHPTSLKKLLASGLTRKEANSLKYLVTKCDVCHEKKTNMNRSENMKVNYVGYRNAKTSTYKSGHVAGNEQKRKNRAFFFAKNRY